MPESTIRALTYWEDVKRRYREQLEDIGTGISNIPGSFAENFIKRPIEGIISMGADMANDASKLASLDPMVYGRLALKYNPLSPVLSPDRHEQLKNTLQGMYEDYKTTYSNPNLLRDDPMRPVADILQLMLLKGGRPHGTFLKNVVMKRAVPAAEQITERLFRTDNTANMVSALKEQQALRSPLNLAQTTETTPTFFQPQRSAALDPQIAQKNLIQQDILKAQGQRIIDQGTGGSGINLLDESGTVAQKLESTGVQIHDVLKEGIHNLRESIVNKANENVISVPIQETVNKQVTFSWKKIAAPVQLNETYNVVNQFKGILDELQESVIGQNPMLYAGYKNILPTINAFLNNPTATTSPLLRQFATKMGAIDYGGKLGDLNTILDTRRAIQDIRTKLPAGFQKARVPLQLLDEALANDARASLNNPLYNSKHPGLGDQFSSYNAIARDILLPYNTPIGQTLSRTHGEGITKAQIAQDPSTAFNAAMTDITKFKHLVDVVGPTSAREALIYDVFKNSFDELGDLNYTKLYNEITKHSDKWEMPGIGSSKLKYDMGNFAYAVKAQNRMPPPERASQALNIRGGRGIANMGVGVVMARPGIFGIGVGAVSEILFDKYSLVRIVSDPGIAYQAARLMGTSVKGPTFQNRMSTFFRTLGKTGIVGQARNIDGSTIPVKFTETGNVVPANTLVPANNLFNF